jgi:beta-galactosidase
MVFFRVRYTDQNGELKPMEKHTVRIEAENGTVMGAANASCCFRGNFAQREAPSYFGEMQTVVQAGTAGVLRVTAADGERSATAEIPVKEG